MMKARINGILLSFFVFIIYTIVFILQKDDTIVMSDVKILGCFAIIQLLSTFYSWYKAKGTVFDAYSVFVVVLYCFTLAQPILETLDLPSSFRRLWHGYGITSYYYYCATYFNMASSAFFHIGALASLRPLNMQLVSTTEYRNQYIVSSMKKTGLFLCVLSLPFYIYNLIQSISIVMLYGYMGIYEEEYTTRSYSIIGDMFTPAMILLFASCMLSGKHEKIVGALAALLIFFPSLFIGGRSTAIILLAIMFVLMATLNKLSYKKLAVIIVVFVGMLYLLNLIAATRTSNERSFSALAEASATRENNPITSTLTEMGWSMYPLALSIETIPNEKKFSYGTSYFWAIVSCIPNLGFWEGEHPGKLNDPGYWINSYAGLGYGIGYSITAGAYNEFGYLGIIIMFIYGWIFCRIFANVSSDCAIKKPLQYVLALIFLWYAIKFVRNSYNSFCRNLVFYILPIYMITKFFYKLKIRK